jgi:hypothetical protein
MEREIPDGASGLGHLQRFFQQVNAFRNCLLGLSGLTSMSIPDDLHIPDKLAVLNGLLDELISDNFADRVAAANSKRATVSVFAIELARSGYFSLGPIHLARLINNFLTSAFISPDDLLASLDDQSRDIDRLLGCTSDNPADLQGHDYEALWADIADIWAPKIASAPHLQETVHEIRVNLSVLKIERFILESITARDCFGVYRQFPIARPSRHRPIMVRLSDGPPPLPQTVPPPAPSAWTRWGTVGILVGATVIVVGLWLWRRKIKNQKGKRNNTDEDARRFEPPRRRTGKPVAV